MAIPEMTKTGQVNTQKIIASEVMDKVKIIDPYALLAGGAPRDWFFGDLCNDLDIYYYSNADQSDWAQSQIESGIGIPVEPMGSSDLHEEGLYRTMPFIKRVFQGTYKGIPVQFIQLTENKKQFEVVGEMDVSICQCWYNHYTDTIVLSDNFKLSLQTQSIFTTNGNSWSETHPKKIAERFPSYRKLTKDQVVSKVISDRLKLFDPEMYGDIQ